MPKLIEFLAKAKGWRRAGLALLVGQAPQPIGIGLITVPVLVGNGFNHLTVHYALQT